MEEQQIIDDIAPTKKSRHRKKLLYSSIKQQMEFYFSDVNISKDRFIAQQLQQDEFVELSIFLQFNKIRRLTTEVSDLCKAISKSEILELSEDNLKVRRKTPIHVKENEDECTIYVERLPADTEHEWLQNLFSKFGPVDYVSIPRYKHNKKIKGFAFIEFKTPEIAKKALEYFESIGSKLPTTMLPDKLASISTFETEKSEKSQNILNKFTNEIQTENKSESTELETKPTNKRKDSDDSKETNAKKKMKKNETIEKMETTEEINSNENELKTKESKKKKKQEQEVAETEKTETSETVETNETTETKKKKKKKQEQEVADTEKRETSETAETNETTETKKKKKKKQEQEVADTEKTETSETAETNEITETKKKKKDKQEQQTDVTETENAETNEGTEIKKKKKKMREPENENAETENLETNETTETESKIEEIEEQDDVTDENETGEKRRRKRKKTKNNANDLQQYGLQVLSKKEWKQLRNKYLNLQRQKMQSVKEQLYRNRNAEDNDTENNDKQVKSAPRYELIPGAIVRITFRDQFSNVNKFKSDIRSQPGLQYVDVKIGSNVGYIRFSDNASAKKFSELENINSDMIILEGNEEKDYWDTIVQSREEKLKKESKKQRGRDKLLRKAEKELGKHIRFDAE